MRYAIIDEQYDTLGGVARKTLAMPGVEWPRVVVITENGELRELDQREYELFRNEYRRLEALINKE